MAKKKPPALTVAQIELINLASLQGQRDLRNFFAKAAWVAGDLGKEERLVDHRGQPCRYLRVGIHGQAFTKWTCQLCPATGEHHNTGVPRLCEECARAYNLCRWCMADIGLNHRRKRYDGGRRGSG